MKTKNKALKLKNSLLRQNHLNFTIKISEIFSGYSFHQHNSTKVLKVSDLLVHRSQESQRNVLIYSTK